MISLGIDDGWEIHGTPTRGGMLGLIIPLGITCLGLIF